VAMRWLMRVCSDLISEMLRLPPRSLYSKTQPDEGGGGIWDLLRRGRNKKNFTMR
jgi:hypothetical protein